MDKQKEITLQPQEEKKTNIKKHRGFSSEKIVVLILAALIALSGIQTYELIKLRNNFDSGTPKAAASESATPLPGSLNNLPDMVGGC